MKRLAALLLLCAACGSGSSARDLAVDAHVPEDLAPSTDGGEVDLGVDLRGSYLLYETFDAYATAAAPGTPWTTVGNILVEEVPFASDKSAEIAKPTMAGTASLSTTFPPQSGRVVFEAKVKAQETAAFKAIPYVYDPSGAAVASVAFQDGNIVAHVGTSTVVVQPFVANEWYRVRVVVDTTQGVFDLFVDGVRKLVAQPLRNGATSVARVAYFIDGTNTGTLFVDNVKVYTEASFIGAPPSPVFDVHTFGAKGDGTTLDTAAIQQAIDAAKGTGGSVLLAGGTFLSGSLVLGSDMTFFVDSSAKLIGTTDVAQYPTQAPATGNTQLLNCQRALLYAAGAKNLVIDGGGTLDGQGDAFSGLEGTRPILVWVALSSALTIRNLYLMKGAVWSLVSMESDDVYIGNVNVQSDGITHDGIDIVDGKNILVEECAVLSGDDAMCLKSGIRRGIDGLTVRRSSFGGSGTSGGSNGIKLGTATYGALSSIDVRDCTVKNVQYAAMAVESRQGSDVSQLAFEHIEFANAGAALFVYLAQQAVTAPTGDVPKLGSIDHVSFTDVRGSTASWGNSPHQGSLVTGHVYEGTTYPITNLSFTNVVVSFDAGSTAVPQSPPEATPNQYPESNMFGDLPAWAYYLRHVSGVTFSGCASTAVTTDARPKLVTDDVTGLVGTP